MMKFGQVLTVFVLSASCFAGEEIIARWDFSSGSINSTDGKYQAVPRGTTRIAGEGKDRVLAVGLSHKEKPEGIVLKSKYPELSPKGAFGIAANIRMHEQTSTQPFCVIWDSKYINYGLNDRKPDWHHGVIFYLARAKDEMWIPQAVIGFGDFSCLYSSKPVKLGEGEKHSVAFEYNGTNAVTFKVDGKVISVYKNAKGGDMSPAHYPVTIGDRFGSTFNRFDGDIFNLTLYRVTPAASK